MSCMPFICVSTIIFLQKQPLDVVENIHFYYPLTHLSFFKPTNSILHLAPMIGGNNDKDVGGAIIEFWCNYSDGENTIRSGR